MLVQDPTGVAFFFLLASAGSERRLDRRRSGWHPRIRRSSLQVRVVGWSGVIGLEGEAGPSGFVRNLIAVNLIVATGTSFRSRSTFPVTGTEVDSERQR